MNSRTVYSGNGQCALFAKSSCVTAHWTTPMSWDNFANFTRYSQTDIWNLQRSCQYLNGFSRWPSKARGHTFLHSDTNVVKSVRAIIKRLTLFALYVRSDIGERQNHLTD